MAKSSREVIKRLTDDGWRVVKQTGSHRHFKHPVKTGKVTVPHPKKDLSRKTLKRIAEQAGIDLD